MTRRTGTNFQKFIRDQLSGNVLYRLTSKDGTEKLLTPDEFCDLSTREVAEGHLVVVPLAPSKGSA